MSWVCPSWLSFVLYNPVRLKFTDREKILDESGITRDSIVLEVGAGNGFMTEIIAEHSKKVVCVELQDGMIRKLKKRVSGFGNKVEIIKADIASYRAGEAFADACMLYYSFHEVSNKSGAVINISQAIRRNGILSIYEPTVEVREGAMRTTIDMFRDTGFEKELEYSTLFTRFARLRKI